MTYQITPHFALHEFLASETAARMGKLIVPTEQEIQNIELLCHSLLEPVRVMLGKPIVLLSGLRPPWLNMAVRGSRNSAHMHGLAADLKVVGMRPAEFARWLQANYEAEDWPIDQCILEFPPNGWVHLSTAASKPRKQFLTAIKVGTQTEYTRGIV